jgi:hypothetical protein
LFLKNYFVTKEIKEDCCMGRVGEDKNNCFASVGLVGEYK